MNTNSDRESDGMSTSSGKLKSGINAAEAGRLSGAARRAKKQEADLSSEQKVEQALRRKAEQGDVAAARELREWIALRRAKEQDSLNADILRVMTDLELDTLIEAIEARLRA
jgi:hypothetical protein